MITISEADVRDEALLRTAWETERTAVLADRPEAVLRPWSSFHMTHSDPSPYYRRVLLVARDMDRVIGTAELGGSTQDNPRLGDLDVNVVPDRRREGIGRRLHDQARTLLADDARMSVVGEAFSVADGTGPGVPFAEAMGAEVVHVEDHLVLRLAAGAPVAEPPFGEPADGDDYEILTWGSRCPDEHTAAYCSMMTQMSNDVPMGTIDHTPVVHDVERLRSSEERTGRSYHQLVAVARRTTDGTLGGYTKMFVPRDGSDALQDDTLVMPEHRGRRLGRRLKASNLEALARDHPTCPRVHTWTDPDNHAMYRTNSFFGFLPVERLHEVQSQR